MRKTVAGSSGQAGPKRESARERGATAVEYALMVALIAIAIIGAVTGLGNRVGASMNKSSGSLAAGTETVTTVASSLSCTTTWADGYWTATPGWCFSPTREASLGSGWYAAA